jgi:hypothetical protein
VGIVLLAGTTLSGSGLGDVFRSAWGALLFIVLLPMYLLSAVFVSILALCGFLFPGFSLNWGGQGPQGQNDPPPGPNVIQWLDRFRQGLTDPGSQSGGGLPPEVITIITIGVVAVAVIVGVVLMSFGLRRRRKKQESGATQERESFGSWALFFRQMRDAMARLLARLRRKKPQAGDGAVDELAALRARPEMSGTLSVREIYAYLQRAAATLGYPRAPQQTPTEYLAVLSSAIPDLRRDFSRITAAYIEARYGPLPASLLAVRAATEAWRRAEPALRTLAQEAAAAAQAAASAPAATPSAQA